MQKLKFNLHKFSFNNVFKPESNPLSKVKQSIDKHINFDFKIFNLFFKLENVQ